MITHEKRRNTVKHAFLHAALLLLLTAFFFQPVVDPDFFGHLLYGTTMLDFSGVLPSVNVVYHNQFSFSVPQARWIDHEWLFQVGLALIQHYFGRFGIVLFQLLASFTLSVLLYRMRTRGLRRGIPVMGGLLLPVLGIRYGFGLRPQIVTYIGLALVYFLMFAWPKHRAVVSVLLPLLFVGWANMHGGFMAGLVVVWTLMPWALWDRCQNRTHSFLIVTTGLASTAVTLFNPYGIALWEMVMEASLYPFTRVFIVDWRPLLSRPWLFAIGVGLVIQAAIWWGTQWSSEASLRIIPVILTAVMAFVSLRNLPLLAISVAAVCTVEGWKPSDPNLEIDRPLSLSATAILILGMFIAVRLSGGLIVPEGLTPDSLARVVESPGRSPRVFIHYNWSQWFLYHRPGARVYFDARYDTAYPRKIIRRYVTIVRGSLKHLNQSGAGWVIVPHWYPINRRLNDSRKWKQVKRTNQGLVWRRRSRSPAK